MATALGEREFGSPQGYTTHLAPEVFTTHKTTELTDIYAMGITLFRACNYMIDNWELTIQNIPNVDEKLIKGKLLDAIGYQDFIPSKVKK